MQRLFLSACLVLFACCVLPKISVAQTNAGCDIKLVSASDDSVTLKAEFYTPSGVSFRLQAIYIALGYDPALFTTDSAHGVMNQAFAAAGFSSDSNPRLDTNQIAPDISLYGEYEPNFSSIPYPANTLTQVCTFMFLPLTQGGGTATFSILGNQPTAAMSGYYITTSLDNQMFIPANDLMTYYPVEFAVFTAAQQGRAVELRWVTASETSNKGFTIERRSPSVGEQEWKDIDYVAGRGTSRTDAQYICIDRSLTSDGVYEYRLRQQDFDGSTTYSPVATVEYRTADGGFSLDQNYPNPVSSNAPTMFRYSIPERSRIRFTITNTLGQRVATLASYSLEAGSYTESWIPKGLPSGIYIATLTAESEANTTVHSSSIRVRVLQ